MLFRFAKIVILDFFIILNVYLTYQAHQINDSIKRIIFAFKLEYHLCICSPNILESSKILPFGRQLKFSV